ncbi:hypothetical protein TD95_000049 [Thielaviopsis punctulata]|uniref:Endosomal/vacuolar adapter protein YPT35 n=1 Tax=Thielaviopsis punctulata TaxID=72032 RepID=A0A0F4Z847_9PEZI|nr:hypothetical protein TD95_000049 [Thielaviopsis punctulata]
MTISDTLSILPPPPVAAAAAVPTPASAVSSSTPTQRPSSSDSATTASTPTVCPPAFWTIPASPASSSPGARAKDFDALGRRRRPASGRADEGDVDGDAAPAIMMRDNESDDLDGRGEACWAKSAEITSWTVVEGSVGNIGAFVVWTIRVDTMKGAPMEIRKRYSEFDSFRHRLLQTFPRSGASVPALPPKTVMARFDKKFLEKRRLGLQHFINCILLNPEFSASPIVKEFLFS